MQILGQRAMKIKRNSFTVYLLLFALFVVFSIIICAVGSATFSLTSCQLLQLPPVVERGGCQDDRHRDAAAQEDVADHVKPTPTQGSIYLSYFHAFHNIYSGACCVDKKKK